ncbi:uncharacterized protein [Hemitrygon akajei]|uniref:uncharacterized protein isoform X2 n=1 Tax=Hemitrygon akajei TaxID=2704970 RepID=UPI003BF9ABC2
MEMITKNENLCENQTDDPSAEGYKLERRKSGNLSPLLIYTLLGFCILLSVAVLIVTLRLETSDADLCMDDSLWKSNVTKVLREITALAAGLQMEFSQWRSHVAGNYEEAVSSIAALQEEISQLTKNTETSIRGVRNEHSQWKNNVAVNFKKTDSSIAELQDDILQLKNNLQRCPTEWTQFRKSCYQFSSGTQTWTEAQRHCASVDSHLVVINNAEEQDFLRRTLQNRHWIGLSDVASEGDWRWVDGTDYSSSSTYWSEGEPNNEGEGEDCAEIFDNGEWNDLPCDNRRGWICEKSALIPLLM